MKNYKLIVVLPIGPTCKEEFIRDTIDSIIYFCSNKTKIILVDDSVLGLGDKISKSYEDIRVLKNEKNLGKHAGLYLTLCKGFKYAIENYSFDVLLRMDTDALITGENPEIEAIKYFKEHLGVGAIGSYKLRYDGNKRDFDWPKKRLTDEISWKQLRKGILRYKGIIKFRNLIKSANKYDYIFGEHCMGGAVFYSFNCIKKLYTRGLLPIEEIYWSDLSEDMIFGLLVKSLGIEMGEFNSEKFPLGVAWQGLPDSPENLFNKHKKVIHSTKYYKEMTEVEIRSYFKQKRI